VTPTQNWEQREREKLLPLLVAKSYKEKEEGSKPFILASGKTSRFYLDCQSAFSDPQTFRMIVNQVQALVYRQLTPTDKVQFGGIGYGGLPIALSISKNSYSWPWFLIRSSKKKYGMEHSIEGVAPALTKDVILFEDVVTSGSSVLKAIEVCRMAGLNVIGVYALVARSEEGMGRIRNNLSPDTPVMSVFTLDDLQAAPKPAPAMETDHT